MHGRNEKDSEREIIERFCRAVVDQGRSPVTAKNYRSDLRGFVDWAGSRHQKDFSFRDIAKDDLRQYRESILGRFKAATVNRKISALKVFLRWATDTGLVERQEMPQMQNLTLPSMTRFRPRCLDRSEQQRLLQSVETSKSPSEIAAILLMLHSGIRASELCSLRWGDVEIHDNVGTVTLRSGTGRNSMSIPLCEKTCNALRRMGYFRQSEKTQLIFTRSSGPATRRWVDMLVERYSRMAGINKVTPTTLRHSFSANLANGGANPFKVALLARYSNLEMIQSFYHVVPVSAGGKIDDVALRHAPLRDLEMAAQHPAAGVQGDIRIDLPNAKGCNLPKTSNDARQEEDETQISLISLMTSAVGKISDGS